MQPIVHIHAVAGTHERFPLLLDAKLDSFGVAKTHDVALFQRFGEQPDTPFDLTTVGADDRAAEELIERKLHLPFQHISNFNNEFHNLFHVMRQTTRDAFRPGIPHCLLIVFKHHPSAQQHPCQESPRVDHRQVDQTAHSRTGIPRGVIVPNRETDATRDPEPGQTHGQQETAVAFEGDATARAKREIRRRGVPATDKD
jgi:hypothetical protein